MEINKKAQGDSLAVGFFIFLIVIIGYIFYTIFNAMSGISIVTAHNESIKVINDAKDLYSGLDFAVPGILLAVNIGAWLMLFFLRSNPILSIVSIILIPITILVSAAVSNAYESVELSLNLATQFPISHIVMAKLPLIIFGMDVIGGILLFAILL